MPDHSYIYLDTFEFIDALVDEYDVYQNLIELFGKGDSSLSLSKKALNKHIDELWVSAIEECLVSIDRLVRDPRKDLKEIEQVMPIELSRNINAKSIRHLSQHTDFINKIENGYVTPSKILNVYREETIETYENKFVNTLIDRLYTFVYKRYEQLKKYGSDESSSKLDFIADINHKGTELKISFSLEAKDSEKATTEASGTKGTMWERVEHIKSTVDIFKGSVFCKTLGTMYIRPPIMRTNAIMKNIDLKACMVLWQFIEGYDKVGYHIDVSESMETPDKVHVRHLYSMLAMQYIAFRYHMSGNIDEEAALKLRKTKTALSPRVVRDFDGELIESYDLHESDQRKIIAVFPDAVKKKLTEEEVEIKKAIENALMDEKKFKADILKSEKEKQKKNPRKFKLNQR